MIEPNDYELLLRYARTQSESAFASLVARYVNLVYSAALRFTGNPHHAQEIAQAVFIILARKAASLRRGTILSGWLYQTARLTAANFVKGEIRRQRREQEAYMRSTLAEPNTAAWEQIAPLLDDALGRLGETDRNAILLRFFENKTASEAAAKLGLSEAASHKRVSRALEKLRKDFMKQGVTLSAPLIAGALSANSVQAAPTGVEAAIAVTVAKGAGAASSVTGLVEGTLSVMAWLKLKFALGIALSVVVVGGSLAVALWPRSPNASMATRSVGATQGAVAPGPVLAEAPVAAPREPLTAGALLSLGSPPGGLLVQPDGKIIVAASLSGFYVDPQSGKLGQFQRGAFRLNPDGSLDRGFCSHVEFPGSDAHRAHLALESDGRVFLAGLLDSVDSQPRPGYARLLADGRVDESFAPWPGSTNPPARTYLPGGVYPATALSDGSVAVLSAALEGPRAPHPLTVYRLDAAGRLIKPPQTALADGEFSRPSGLVLTLGPAGFWARKEIDWTRNTPANRRPPFQAGKPASDLPGGAPVADLPFERWTEPPSSADAAVVLRALFEEVPLELCRYAARLPDGGTILAIRGGFMRFDQNWRPDFSFTNQYEADPRSCLTLKRQKDGKYLVAGLIGTMNGKAFSGVVRLKEDGQIDPGFHCETENSVLGRVMDFAVQPDGRIVICGFFKTVNGVPCQYLARLKPDGSLDDTFKNPFVTLAKFQSLRFPVHHLAPPPAASLVSQATTPEAAQVAGPQAAPPAETILINSLSRQGEVAVIQFTGAPNRAYILQGKDSLDAVDWNSFDTNQANVNGTGVLRDNDAKDRPTRFYRIATQ